MTVEFLLSAGSLVEVASSSWLKGCTLMSLLPVHIFVALLLRVINVHHTHRKIIHTLMFLNPLLHNVMNHTVQLPFFISQFSLYMWWFSIDFRMTWHEMFKRIMHSGSIMARDCFFFGTKLAFLGPNWQLARDILDSCFSGQIPHSHFCTHLASNPLPPKKSRSHQFNLYHEWAGTSLQSQVMHAFMHKLY